MKKLLFGTFFLLLFAFVGSAFANESEVGVIHPTSAHGSVQPHMPELNSPSTNTHQPAKVDVSKLKNVVYPSSNPSSKKRAKNRRSVLQRKAQIRNKRCKQRSKQKGKRRICKR